jgi:glucose 1-dehydrogenase
VRKGPSPHQDTLLPLFSQAIADSSSPQVGAFRESLKVCNGSTAQETVRIPFVLVGDYPNRRVLVRGLKDKNVLVTGGTSGIGQSIAVRFAEYGANVAINYLRRPEEAEETEEQVHACVRRVRETGVRDVLVQGDVSKEDEVVRMVEDTVSQLGGLDVLVNNAGIQISRPSHELSSDDFDKVLAVNLRGAFLCAREAIKRFVGMDTPGAVINVSSVHQRIPKPNYLGYSVSKGGMQNLTTTLALEYAGKGIRVNGIGPGATITPINRAWVDDPVKREQVTSHIPMSRAGTADEMAGVACFLASDDAAYITGQTLYIDGGLTLYADFREPWSSE